MSGASIDPRLAAAEARLERLDDHDRVDDGPDDPPALLDPHEVGVHVDGDLPDPDLDPDDEEAGADLLVSALADALDAFAEAFNARDVDAVLEVVAEDVEAPGLGDDVEGLPAALDSLWERRPTGLLTRGDLDGVPVLVLWEMADDPAGRTEPGGWWRVGLVHGDDVVDGTLGVVEVSDDASALDAVEVEAPDGDLEEGARWREWESGEEG
ncbi:MAG: hypothetical protein ACLGIR_10465 [Actinomycetes bacterium]